jgi:hypothetical protein
MPPLFDLQIESRERFAESEPEPQRSIRLMSCAYDRAEIAYWDCSRRPDPDPKACSRYLDMMVDAVSWREITIRCHYLSDIFGLRLEFKDRHPKKRLKGKSSWFRLLFTALIGPIRDAVPFMSAAEMEEIRRLTKTPESEERITRARSRALIPAGEREPWPPLPIKIVPGIAPTPKQQRRNDIMWQVSRALWESQENGDAQEFEKQLDTMILTFREYHAEFWYRLFVLCVFWQIRRRFISRYPEKRVAGRSRWFILLGEWQRELWCPGKPDWLPDNFFKQWNEEDPVSQLPDRQIS